MKILKIVSISLLIIFSALPQNKGKIGGKVIDKTTLKPIPDVNIIIIGKPFGAATDTNGVFEISGLENGSYQVRASAVGYKSETITDVEVNYVKTTNLLFQISEQPISLLGVTVNSDYFQKNVDEFNSLTNLNYEEIRRSPGGFEDVVRALSILPGVAQSSAGRNDLVVRGGAPSENLYLVDGFVIPNINHFGTQGATGGPISFINLDFVRETSFSSGGFPVNYGNKLSSVLSIDLRNGRSDRIGGKATISASEFGLDLEGPVTDKSSFIFSLRRSYLDFIFNAAGFNFVPEYYDALSKVTFNMDSKNQISVIFLGALDYINFNNSTSDNLYQNSKILGSNQHNYFVGVSFQHLFDNGFYNLRLSRNYTNYNSFQNDTLLNPIFINNSGEGYNELKADAVLKVSKSSEIDLGGTADLNDFSANIKLPYFISSFGDTLLPASINTSKTYSSFGLYTEFSSKSLDRLNLSLGIRGDYYGEINDKLYVSPRFSAKYNLNDISNVNFSLGMFRQRPSYIWLVANPINKNLTAILVDQYILGYQCILREDTRLKIEAFYKNYNYYPASITKTYLVLANTGAGFGGSQDNFASFGLDPLISKGFGNARGVELSVQKKDSKIPYYGIISLTYSRTVFTPLNGIQSLGSYDQTWILNLSGGYIFNNEWEASFKFRFATGNPYTPYNSSGLQNAANYNTERLPSLNSLDIRVDKRWNLNNWALITYLDIQNIYNHRNVASISWDYRTNSLDESKSIGILPSIGISVEF